MPQQADVESSLDPKYDYMRLPDGSYASFPKGTSPDVMRQKVIAAGLVKQPSAQSMQPAQVPARGLTQPGQVYSAPAITDRPATHAEYSQLAPDPKSWYGYKPRNLAHNVLQAGHDIKDFAQSFGHDVLYNPNWVFEKNGKLPTGKPGETSMLSKYIAQPALRESRLAHEADKAGHGSEFVGHALASTLPFVGPLAASLGEQAGSTDVGGAMARGVGYALTGRALSNTTSWVDPDKLERAAAEQHIKVTKMAESKSPDFNHADNLEAAQRYIRGTLRQMAGDSRDNPGRVELERRKVHQQTDQLVDTLSKAGQTVDLQQDLISLQQEMVKRINDSSVKLDPKDVDLMNKMLDAVKQTQQARLNPQTGKMEMGPVQPRNLRTMSLRQAVDLQRLLGKDSEFEKAESTVVQSIARRVRDVLSDRIGQASPAVRKMQEAESHLINVRGAYRERYASVLAGRGRTIDGIFTNPKATDIGTYAALKASLGYGGGLAATMALKLIFENPVYRTNKAAGLAMLAKILRWSDEASNRGARQFGQQLGRQIGSMGRFNGPQPPPAGPVGGGPPTGGPGPQGPVAAPNAPPATLQMQQPQGVTAQPARPAAPAQPAPAPAAQLKLPQSTVEDDFEQDRRAGKVGEPAPAQPSQTVGSVAGAERDTAIMAQLAKEHPDWSLSQHLQEAAKIANPQSAQPSLAGGNVAENNIKTEAQPAKPSLTADEKSAKLSEGKAKRAAAKEAQLKARNKAMLDRLDDLYERQASPKSAMDRANIEREINDIKRILKPDVDPREASLINERAKTRDRQVKFKEKQKAMQQGVPTGVGVGGTVEPIDQGGTPQQILEALETGYKMLSKYENGPDMVKSFKAQAAAARKVGQPYDELETLKSALQMLQQLTPMDEGELLK